MYNSPAFPYDELLTKIELAISQNHHTLTSLAIKDGILGLSLFYYHYFLYTNEKKYLHLSGTYLDRSLTLVRKAKIQHFSPYDLLELGRFIIYLKKNDILQSEDIPEFLSVIDYYAFELLENQLNKKNLDSVQGVVGIGYYFLETSSYFNRDNPINRIINIITNTAISADDNSLYWKFPSAHLGENILVKRYGNTNGQAGVLNLLLKLSQNGFHSYHCLQLIDNNIRDLLKSKGNYPGSRTFPYALLPEGPEPYQNIAYGDIGIGNFLYRYGIYINRKDIKNIGIHTIEKASEFRDDQNLFIKDAPLLHGTCGLAAFFESYTKKVDSSKIINATSYWKNKTLKLSTFENKWAGFETYFNGYDDRFRLSFGYGISGIGTYLICSKLGIPHSYLSFFNFHLD